MSEIFLKQFISLFAIIDPIGLIPIYLAMVVGIKREQELKLIKTASISVFVTLTLSAFVGSALLSFFGISMASFEIAGGVILLWMGFGMLTAENSSIKNTSEESAEANLAIMDDKYATIAIVPLAIPLLAGPASISTVILQSQGDWTHLLSTLFVVFFISIIVYYVLKLANPISKKMGTTGMHVITRIMGLIIVALSIEIISKGLIKMFPILAGTF